MIQLRTIKQSYDFVKSQDKESAVTLYFIRTLCRQNKIEFKKAGSKILVNLGSLLSYLVAANSAA